MNERRERREKEGKMDEERGGGRECMGGGRRKGGCKNGEMTDEETGRGRGREKEGERELRKKEGERHERGGEDNYSYLSSCTPGGHGFVGEPISHTLVYVFVCGGGRWPQTVEQATETVEDLTAILYGHD